MPLPPAGLREEVVDGMYALILEFEVCCNSALHQKDLWLVCVLSIFKLVPWCQGSFLRVAC